jgi:hypothetical protein
MGGKKQPQLEVKVLEERSRVGGRVPSLDRTVVANRGGRLEESEEVGLDGPVGESDKTSLGLVEVSLRVDGSSVGGVESERVGLTSQLNRGRSSGGGGLGGSGLDGDSDGDLGRGGLRSDVGRSRSNVGRGGLSSGGGFRGRRRIRVSPVEGDDAEVLVGESGEETLRKVETVVRAAGALILDGRSNGLATVGDPDGLATLGRRVTRASIELGTVHGDGVLVVLVQESTSTESDRGVVVGASSTRRTLGNGGGSGKEGKGEGKGSSEHVGLKEGGLGLFKGVQVGKVESDGKATGASVWKGSRDGKGRKRRS